MDTESVFEGEPFPHKIGAFSLIFNKNKGTLGVLLVKRRDLGIWNLPGGGVDRGETISQAAVRETKEETGLDISPVVMVGIVYDPPRSSAGREPVGAEVRADIFGGIIGLVTGGTIQCGGESEEIAFFPVDALPNDLYKRHELLISIVASDPDMERFIHDSISAVPIPIPNST